MNKILITGGAGFIGSEVVRQLVKNGYSIAVIDKLTYAGDFERIAEIKDDFQFYQADICDINETEKVFNSFKPEFILHLAAESHVDKSILSPDEFISTNVMGTLNLLELSKKYGIERFLNMSTDEVYGELGATGQFSESTPLNPNSPYSVSKASADMLGRSYFRTFDLPVITARPSNNYGPWQYPEKFIPVVLLKAFRNHKIPVYGNGSNIREWLYVGDCANALIQILFNGKIGEAYNIGSNNEKTNLELVKFILSVLNKPLDLIEFVKDRPGHDFRYSLDYSKLRNELKWDVNIKFEDGMKNTMNWNLENMNWLEKKLDYLNKYWKIVYK